MAALSTKHRHASPLSHCTNVVGGIPGEPFDTPVTSFITAASRTFSGEDFRAPKLPKDHLMVINLSGRGDKDMQTVMHYLNLDEQAAEETRA